MCLHIIFTKCLKGALVEQGTEHTRAAWGLGRAFGQVRKCNQEAVATILARDHILCGSTSIPRREVFQAHLFSLALQKAHIQPYWFFPPWHYDTHSDAAARATRSIKCHDASAPLIAMLWTTQWIYFCVSIISLPSPLPSSLLMHQHCNGAPRRKHLRPGPVSWDEQRRVLRL